MPFDAAGFVSEVTLDEYLKKIGVTPVPMAQLLAHKKEQVRLHPPSLLATSKPFMACAMLGAAFSFTTHAISGTNLGALVMLGGLTGVFVGLASFFLASSFVMLAGTRLKGRPMWKEMGFYVDPTIPQPILEVAQVVRRTMPANALLLTGELIQNEAVIDPYIVVHLNGERACLGIWLDDNVIACASVND